MNGCSAQKNDSKPSSSAFLAMRPGSTRYAGSGMETPTFMSLSPHVASDLDDALELLPLLVLGQRVAVVRAGEAVRGQQAAALERHVLRGLVDPSPQRVVRLERARLGGDETQHDLLVARQQAQRLEAARAPGVPFHEIAVDVRREHRLHDPVGIAAGREPRAPEVAAARVHRHRHAGRAIRQRAIDEGGVDARQRGGIVAVGAEIVAHLRVAEIGPAHVVELQIGAAGGRDVADGRPVPRRRVPPEFREIGIGVARDRVAAAAHVEHRRRGDGQLGRRLRHRFQEREVLHHDRCAAPDLADDRRHRRHVLGGEHHADRRRHADALQLRHEVEVPEVAAVLAVGDGAQAERLLLRDGRADAAVFDVFELSRREGAGLRLRARLAQLGRAQQAADLVGPERGLRHHGDLSVEDHAAVDVEGLAGDVPRAGRRQEDGERGDVLGIVRTAERNGGVAAALHLLDRDARLARAGGDVVLRQRGDRGAGTDGVDVDVVRGELLGGGARERDHAALAGGVDRVGRAGVALAGDRGDVDDHAALLRDHLAGHALQAEEHALGVDAHDAVPVRLGEVHDVGAPRDAGVVDEHVDPLERGHRAPHHRVDGGEVADVGLQRQAAAPQARDGVGGGLGEPGVDVRGDDVGARARAPARWARRGAVALPWRPRAAARVVGMLGEGAWAERVAVPTHALAELPEKVTFSQAATFPVAGLTALYSLAKGGLLLDRRVLVTGATGGVGDFALQLARLAGAHVTATARRADQVAALRALGAHDVTVGDEIPASPKYDLILDSVGGRTLGTALSALARGGTCVNFGVSATSEVTFDVRNFFVAGRTTLYGFYLFTELSQEPAGIGLSRLANLVADGRLTPHISVERPWKEIAQVAQDLMARRYPGKAVLNLD